MRIVQHLATNQMTRILGILGRPHHAGLVTRESCYRSCTGWAMMLCGDLRGPPRPRVAPSWEVTGGASLWVSILRMHIGFFTKDHLAVLITSPEIGSIPMGFRIGSVSMGRHETGPVNPKGPKK